MNVFLEFLKIINTDGIQVATVIAKNNHSHTIITQNGQTTEVFGDGDYQGKVFIQHGKIIGQAPDLPYFEVEV